VVVQALFDLLVALAFLEVVVNAVGAKVHGVPRLQPASTPAQALHPLA
jgi:hypothetical protein